MKVASFVALSLAPLAALAVPIVIVESLPPATHHSHTKSPASAPAARPARVAPEVILDVEDAAVQVSFDNSPATPTNGKTPEEILNLPKPIATAYLLSLGSSRGKPTQLSKEAWEVVEASTITQMEIGLVEAHGQAHTRPGLTNCYYYARLTRDHNDRLVVLLVLAFLLTVLLLETWGSIYSSIRQLVSGQGAIRLEDDAESQLLSVRADVQDVEDAKGASSEVTATEISSEKTEAL